MASIAVLPVLIGLAVDYAIQLQSRIGRGGAATPDRGARARGAPTIATAAAATMAGLPGAAALAGADGARLRPAARHRHRHRAGARARSPGTAALVRPRAAARLGVRGAAACCGRRRRVARGVARRGPGAHRAGDLLRAPGRPAAARRVARRDRPAPAPARSGVLAIAAVLALCGWVLDTQTRVESDIQKLVPQDLPALRDLEALQKSTGVGGQLDVLVEADDVTDPKVVDVDDALPERAAQAARVQRASAAAAGPSCAPRSRCPTSSARAPRNARADRGAARRRPAVLLAERRSRPTGGRRRCRSASGSCRSSASRRSSRRCAPSSTRPTGVRAAARRPARARGRGQRARLVGLAAAADARRRACSPSPSCCASRCADAPARAIPLDPDRAGDRLVGAHPVPAADPAEPDVGDARRAGRRDLDRVQRPARPSATARSARRAIEPERRSRAPTARPAPRCWPRA